MATSLASSLAGSPPASPPATRPKSAIFQTHRSSSRVSLSSKQGGSSRASDDDNKTLVKVEPVSSPAVRVRPPLKPTDPGFDLIPQRFQRSMVHVSSPTNLAVESPQGRKLFVFDKVFGEDVYQEGVWEYLNDSVNSFVQGYNESFLELHLPCSDNWLGLHHFVAMVHLALELQLAILQLLHRAYRI
ncbi:MAG: hypothetical protein Q9214_003175 [Letrouitia sp. 1 TL-2023]